MSFRCLACCRKSKKDAVDLDPIERILGVSKEEGSETVHVKFRGGWLPSP